LDIGKGNIKTSTAVGIGEGKIVLRRSQEATHPKKNMKA
jgi:hypothetical protein